MRKTGLILGLFAALIAGFFLYNRWIDRYNQDLLRFLPAEEGHTWAYEGFAEYSHVMTIDTIERTRRQTRFDIAGEVGDPSGGEAERDLSLRVIYTISRGVWVQEKQEEAMLDSDFDRLELLRGPVRDGQQWTQSVIDRAGTPRELLCTIEEIRFEGNLDILVVHYQDTGSAYYERREIETGTGVISFEKLWQTEEGDFPIGYRLFRADSLVPGTDGP